MFLIGMALKTVVLPGLVCALTFWMLGRLLQSGSGRKLVAGVSLAAGYLTAHFLAVGLPAVPPVGTTQWMFPIVALSALLPPAGFRSRAVGTVLQAVFFLALLLVIEQPMFQYHWPLLTGVVVAALLWIALLISSKSLGRLEKTEPDPTVPTVFLVVLAAASAILGLSATSLLAQLAMGMAASLAVLAAVSWRKALELRSWLPVGLVTLWCLMLNGRFYAEVTTLNAALALASPFAAWITRMRPLRDRSSLAKVAAAVVCAGILLLPALILAYLGFVEASSIYDEY